MKKIGSEIHDISAIMMCIYKEHVKDCEILRINEISIPVRIDSIFMRWNNYNFFSVKEIYIYEFFWEEEILCLPTVYVNVIDLSMNKYEENSQKNVIKHTNWEINCDVACYA